jgi:hypothetical protein
MILATMELSGVLREGVLRANVMSLEASPEVPSASYAPAVPVVSAAWNAQLPQVVAITENMFGESPVVETMCDPEDIDETQFALLRVRCRGSSDELLAKHVEWGRRLDAIGAGLQYCLSIIPVT